MNRKARRQAAKAAGQAGAGDPHTLLEDAVRAHRAGQLDRAEGLYRQALAVGPRDPDALNHLGALLHQKGRNEDAVRLMERAIAADGKVASYHTNLGEALRALGRTAEAIDRYRQAAALDPRFADAHYCLGIALFETGDMEGAAESLARAVHLNPEDAEARLNLGNALAALGRMGDAIVQFQEAVARAPDIAAAYLGLGTAMLEEGRGRDAVAALQHAAALDPDLADTHYQLGRAFYRLEPFELAEASFRKALALEPGNAETVRRLARTLRELGKMEPALDAYRDLLERTPDDLDAVLGAAGVLTDAGRFEDAATWLERARSIAPESAEVFTSLGTWHQQQGRFEEAAEWHERALALDPANGTAWYNLASIPARQSPDEQIRLIGAALEAARLSPANRTAMLFAMARAHESAGDYDAAFGYFRDANALKDRELAFDVAVFERYVDRVIAAFTPELFQAKRGFGNPSRRPVFIVGMPRSGTTLIEQIIASHPRAFGAGELDDIRQLTRQVPELVGSDRPYPECVAALDGEAAAELAARYLERLRGLDAEAERVTDKLPVNFQRLGFIALLFPEARVVHCRRDPLDTCLSCFFQHFAHGQRFSYDLAKLGRYYRHYERLAAHWRDVLPLPVLEVPYEALIADPETWTRRILDHVGLPWDPRCLAFHEHVRQIKTASQWQARQPLYKTSVARWRRYEKHLAPLKAALDGVEPETESA